jgi:hypothetical protein
VLRTYYITDVTLGSHPTAPVCKVLTVKMRADDDIQINTEFMMRADLYGYESVKDFKWVPSQSPAPLANRAKEMLDEVAADLVRRVGENNVLSWQLPDLPARIEEFESSWKRKAFGNALRAYGVTKRLTFDQALRVLEEHYIVEPVMES